MRNDTAVTDSLTAHFDENGFVGPIRVLPKSECRFVEKAFREDTFPLPLDWTKGYGSTARLFYDLASRSSILDVVRELLGDDVMLWGTQMVTRPPGAIHSYHTDVETSAPDLKSVSVWVGIKNTSVDSSLRVIPYSHRFGIPLQQAMADAGLDRFKAERGQIEQLALAFEPEAGIEHLDMSDGDALFFDGRLWHGSHNTRPNGVRFAALLQYARPDMPIRIPNFNDHSLPQKFFDHPRPPCIMVYGSDSSNVNRFETGPLDDRAKLPVMTSWIRDLELPLVPDDSTGFRAFPKARGSSAIMTSLTCHVSALESGKSPHDPHEHDDEELLITLSGELDILSRDGDPVHRTRPGTVVYYPARVAHSVSNPGSAVANYLMFKWTGRREGGADSSESELFKFDPDPDPDLSGAEIRTRVFDLETTYLRRLRCHQTVMPPGCGYDPHIDAYDVAIVTLAGTIETLDQSVGPGCVIFYASGEPHGIRCIGSEPAGYLVFEFRGGNSGLSGGGPRRGLHSAAKKVRRRLGIILTDHPRLRKLLRPTRLD